MMESRNHNRSREDRTPRTRARGGMTAHSPVGSRCVVHVLVAGFTVVVAGFIVTAYGLSATLPSSPWLRALLIALVFSVLYFPLTPLLTRREVADHYGAFLRDFQGIAFQGHANSSPLFFRGTVQEITGYTENDFTTGTIRWTDIIHPDDRARIDALRHQHGTPAPEAQEYEYRIVRSDEQIRWIREVVSKDGGELDGPPVARGAIYDVTGLKDAEARMRTHRDQLRSLASRQALSEESERRRLATALHDTVAQPLALAKMKVAMARAGATSQESRSILDGIRELLDESIACTRSLTSELSPVISYEQGFSDALQSLCELTQRRYDLPVEFHQEARILSFDPDVQVTLFQSARELLANVAKHARAKRASVTLRRRGAKVEIEVSDDGVGFGPDRDHLRPDLHGGFGLFSLRERLDLFGGTLRIASEPGRGSRVTVEAPIHDNNTPQEEVQGD